MKDIVKKVEFISMKMKEIEDKYDLLENHSMNLLWWKWSSERDGLISAAGMLGISVHCTDLEGLKWTAEVFVD